MNADPVGFCGVGTMGLPMVSRLLSAGFPVHLWNRSPDKRHALISAGARLHESPEVVADACEVVCLCLSDHAAVEQVVFGDKGLCCGSQMRRLVDHSSISPVTTRLLAKRLLAEPGSAWIDAPVSGGATGTAAGSLTVMAGGDKEEIRRASRMLSSYAGRVAHVGETGAGQLAKLCNQTIVSATISAIAEALCLAEDSGLHPATLQEALCGGGRTPFCSEASGPVMARQATAEFGALGLMLKDIDNVAQAAQASNTPMLVLSAVQQRFRIAVARGGGGRDLSSIVEALRERQH